MSVVRLLVSTKSFAVTALLVAKSSLRFLFMILPSFFDPLKAAFLLSWYAWSLDLRLESTEASFWLIHSYLCDDLEQLSEGLVPGILRVVPAELLHKLIHVD